MNSFRKSVPVTLLMALLGALSLRVEDGQFTREYSRIYTTVVFSVAGLLVLMVMRAASKTRCFIISFVE